MGLETLFLSLCWMLYVTLILDLADQDLHHPVAQRRWQRHVSPHPWAWAWLVWEEVNEPSLWLSDSVQPRL